MDKTVVKKQSLKEQTNDFEYWQQQSYSARLEALEKIRQEYIKWHYGSRPEFQRVYRIIKQK